MRRVLRFSLIALLSVLLFKPAHAQVIISVGYAPPPLPVYEQPPCPEEGWMWVPGYWAWDPDYQDYYWVPGTWVPAPEVGYFWTPPWWGWDADGDDYVFHQGYWGPQVGFYGGINYGYGYTGRGYEGGRWERDRFYYNRSVNNVNVTNIHNVYNTTVVNNYNNSNHVSYNGGSGGIQARPTEREMAAEHERHVPPPPMQVQRRELARSNPQMRASANQGRPPIAATARPTEFSGRGVVQARAAGGSWHPPANRLSSGENNREPGHARELPPHQPRPIPQDASPDERRSQQEQQRLDQRQNQEHQRLEQQQEQEHQRAQQQQWDQQRRQQMEQQHRQQTQQMQQRHEQEQRQMQQRRPEPRPQPQRPQR